MIVAIDPGNRGALAFLGTLNLELLGLYDMPLRESGSKGHMRYEVAGDVLASLLQRERPSCAVLERVASMPGQGIAGMFAFGRGVGVIEGVLQACDIPITYVSPQVWKRHHGLIKQPKQKSRELAQEFYPDAELHLKKHEGRAEAILIGLWKIDKWREL